MLLLTSTRVVSLKRRSGGTSRVAFTRKPRQAVRFNRAVLVTYWT